MLQDGNSQNMKQSIQLCFQEKKPFNSLYSWLANVLLCDKTKTGRLNLLMTFAIVNVFPLPVTPCSTCSLTLFLMPSTNSLIALGWSPAGAYVECNLKLYILINYNVIMFTTHKIKLLKLALFFITIQLLQFYNNKY